MIFHVASVKPDRSNRRPRRPAGTKTIDKLRTLARELAGDAWGHHRRRLSAQIDVRRVAGLAVMNETDAIQSEDTILEEPPSYD